MNIRTFRLLTLAGLAASAASISAPVLAHDGRGYGRDNHARYFGLPGARVVFVRPPAIVRRPVVVFRPAPVYYAPAPVYYPTPVYRSQPAWGIVGGAIAGAAIGNVIGEGRPGAIAAGSVIGAAVGGSFAR